MIVELAGLPGSGKTTIVRRLLAEDPGTRSQVVVPAPLDALVRPVAAARLLVRSGVADGSGAWLSLVLRRLHQDRLAAPKGERLLLEEGIVHHLWRALVLHPRLEGASWSSLVDSPHPLLVLEAAPGTRHSRVLGKRSGGPINRELAASGPEGAYWRRGESLFEAVLGRTDQLRRVLRVTTEGDLEEATRRVREALTALA